MKYGLGRRCVMSSAAAETQDGHFVLRRVVGDRQQLEGRERSEDGVDFVALDQLLHLGLGAGGIAAGVGGEELDVAAGDLVVVFLQPGHHALFHLDAALRQRTGLDGEQAELEGRCLRDGRRGEFEGRRGGAGRGRGHEFTARNLARHCIPPIVALSGLCCLWPYRPFSSAVYGLIDITRERSAAPTSATPQFINPSSANIFHAVKPRVQRS